MQPWREGGKHGMGGMPMPHSEGSSLGMWQREGGDNNDTHIPGLTSVATTPVAQPEGQLEILYSLCVKPESKPLL